jgi:uncharacterized membrane protein YeaQ/YmgE (transglycosylase-associated protein family)
MWLMMGIAAAGAIAGAIISYSMDMKSPRELIQGAVGGFIAAALISLMLPK